jgi:DNA-binding NtrC family response regulator
MITYTVGLSHAAPGLQGSRSSEAMQRVESEALEAARWDANVLITGEPGACKAALARFIHEHSARSSRKFAAIACESLPGLLLESALFGHVRGSFAGAYDDKAGLLESVPGGTVYLDDVSALSLRTQARLLRYLETGESLRIGGTPVQVQPWLSVRLIVSTTAHLPSRAAAGLFLDELYIRLSVARVTVPPLRDRPASVPALVDSFAEQFAVRLLARSGTPASSAAARDARRSATKNVLAWRSK